MRLKTTLNGKIYEFKNIVDLLAKANEPKSADRFQRIAAETVSERIAAKVVLSAMTIKDLTENPSVDYDKDEVTRVNIDGLNTTIYNKIKQMTIGELRNYILDHKTTGLDITRISRGLSAEVIAATAKIMSSMDLVYGAKKIRIVTRCNTEIGKEGTLSFRCQTNSSSDDIESIVLGLMEGASYGSGDACFGINPVEDTVENTIRLANGIYEFIDKFQIPTQNTVLSHITTQMKSVEKGAPLSMFFQSIAGTQTANENFGVSKQILDEAYALIKQKGISAGPNLMYFETGQGSEVSLGCDMGVDEMTLEARTYGFARNYFPFLVNNVSGFIGPETLYDGKEMIRANLEDHFMGKLTGLPMGMAPCYTNHTSINQDDQEMATMLLAMAGANYYMGIPCGDDVMLSYQDTSFHDDATLRELLGLKPAHEFHMWLIKHGLMDESGKLTEIAGDGSYFFKSKKGGLSL